MLLDEASRVKQVFEEASRVKRVKEICVVIDSGEPSSAPPFVFVNAIPSERKVIRTKSVTMGKSKMFRENR